MSGKSTTGNAILRVVRNEERVNFFLKGSTLFIDVVFLLNTFLSLFFFFSWFQFKLLIIAIVAVSIRFLNIRFIVTRWTNRRIVWQRNLFLKTRGRMCNSVRDGAISKLQVYTKQITHPITRASSGVEIIHLGEFYTVYIKYSPFTIWLVYYKSI